MKKNNKLDLTTLETRKLRQNLIEVVKILKGYENINKDLFFYVTVQPLWSFIKVRKRVRLDVAKFSFSNRAVNE